MQYFLATLKGEVTLPSLEEMTAIVHKTDQERREQGLLDKHYHTLSTTQFEYLGDLAREAGLEQPPPFMPQLLRIVLLRLFFSFSVFKSYSYELSGDGVIIEALGEQRVATNWDLVRLILTGVVRCFWRDFPAVVGFFGSHLMNKFRAIFRVSK